MAKQARRIVVVDAAVVRFEFENAVHQTSVTAFARRAGASVTSVGRAFRGEGLGNAIPAALGYRRVVGYERIGAGGEAPPEPVQRWRMVPGDAETTAPPEAGPPEAWMRQASAIATSDDDEMWPGKVRTIEEHVLGDAPEPEAGSEDDE